MREELVELRPREVLFASSLPLFDRAPDSRGRGPCRARASNRSDAWPRPADDWVFSPTTPSRWSKIILACSRWKASAWRTRRRGHRGGAILHYVRTTQRGTLDHVDRIGYYERQNCLVLDAVTVRNLELVEPLFSGRGDAVTLFRSLDATVTPMGKRVLRSWMLRPSIDIGGDRRSDSMRSRHDRST